MAVAAKTIAITETPVVIASADGGEVNAWIDHTSGNVWIGGPDVDQVNSIFAPKQSQGAGLIALRHDDQIWAVSDNQGGEVRVLTTGLGI